ncbi:MAG: hypothetical protein RL139_1354 [Gemmatimonadota bacterium]
MFLLLLLMACAEEPETAEDWCRLAQASMCECRGFDDANECNFTDCSVQVPAQAERWGDAYVLELWQCAADNPCDTDVCPSP